MQCQSSLITGPNRVFISVNKKHNALTNNIVQPKAIWAITIEK